jgi:hypothetical protein
MNKNSRWQYILVGIGALIVIIDVFLLVTTYYHVPLETLLPSRSKTKGLSPPPTLAILKAAPSPVEKLNVKNGMSLYVITGKFVTAPIYNAQNILQGDFVIDKDPAPRKIPVVMTGKTGTISVVRSKGSFDGGKNVVTSESTEHLRLSIKVGAPVQLRIYPVPPATSVNDIPDHKILDNIMAGNWSIPDNFVLRPPMVGLLE